MRQFFDSERDMNYCFKVIKDAHNVITDYNTKQEVEEFATFGQTLKGLKMMVVNNLATPEAAATFASNCEAERYGRTEPDYNTYYSTFVTAKADYKKETLERKVLEGFTIDELRKCVELEALTKRQAAYAFASCYIRYFQLDSDEFDHFYDEDAFDPTSDFGFIKNEGE